MYETRLFPVFVFARVDSPYAVVSRDLARALGRINFMKSPLYSHRKHHTSVAASNGAATCSLFKRTADAFKGGTYVSIEPALRRSSSYRNVHSSAFCTTTNGLPAGFLCCRNFVHDTAPSPQTYVANITRPPIVKRATYIF